MLSVVLQGIVTGCLYALGAMGLVMIFKSSRVVNFAHGALAGLSTYVVYALTVGGAHWPWAAAAAIALVAAVLLSAIVYFAIATLSPLKHADVTATIATLGVAMVAQGIVLWRFGSNVFRLDLPLPHSPMSVLGLSISLYDIVVLLATIGVITVLFFVIDRTRLGISFRAVSTDPFAARVCGLSIARIHFFSWVVSAILGMVAALLIVPTTFLSPTSVMNFMLLAFAAAVIGGFDSLPGSAIGGILVGVGSNLFSFFVSPELINSFLLVLILISLSVFPGGILSKRMGSRV